MAQTKAWRALRGTLVGAMVGALVGCGGESGGVLGGGQDPDPAVQDFPLVYVKRPLLRDEDTNELLEFEVRDPTVFMPGAELFIRDRASASAVERSITAGVFPNGPMGAPPMYDVKDLSSSYDGRQLVFAMRAPEIPNADDDEQPTWNIWVYDVDSETLGRVISSDIVAEDGQDVSPHFLPDGRIVFASTRQRDSKAILLDEGKPQFAAQEEGRDRPALTLHVMDADGGNIHQISFNQSHDMDPSVLADGRIIYSRWDQIANHDEISLYTMNPDGTDQKRLYGGHSHDTGPAGEDIEFVEPQELPDGRVLVTMRTSSEQSHLGAAPVAIDTANYVEHDQPTFSNAGLTADAQELLVPGDIQLETISPRGRFASVTPLFDDTDRLLVTWSQCRLLDPASPDPMNPVIVPCTPELLAIPGIPEAPPLYGVWMFDVAGGTQQPLVTPEEGFAYTEATVVEARTPPVVRLDKVAGLDFDPDLVSENVGVLHIHSVYDFDGIATQPIATLRDPAVTLAAARPARFLRVVKAVSIPDDDLVDLDNTAFGASAANLMREIIGYAPIEPDGSVKMKIPANIAFGLEVLDANGRRTSQRHQNWMTLRAGEVMECSGCHTSLSQRPHGRPDAEAPSANPGAPADGSPFPNTEPALFANAGETMAETYTRINGIPRPNVDIEFDDVWTDPNVRAKDASFAYEYAALTTSSPVDPGCVANWVASCRIVVSYESKIHPIWGTPRLAADGVTDLTCNTCHAPADAAAAPQVPAGQLDLTDGQSPDEADHFNSYRELLFTDNQQEVLNGALVDRLIQDTDANGNPLFQTDANGNLLLDANGQPIPVLINVTTPPSMSPGGALASPRFFSRFNAGGTHVGYLTGAELKLISEWLDVGAQYYNDPFAVPQN